MDPYDEAYVPPGFGLNNTGAICYFNSLLQLLVGCTALTRAVLAHPERMAQTRTGAALLRFVQAYAGANGRLAQLAPGIEAESARVLAALEADLAERRPRVRFGAGQESASEALTHLLDMLEPPAEGDAPCSRGVECAGAACACARLRREADPGPVGRLFRTRHQCDLTCAGCQKVVSSVTDFAAGFNLYYFDALPKAPATPAQFASALIRNVQVVDDFTCEACAEAGTPNTRAYRAYTLKLIPEIVVCAFNLYVEYGGSRKSRYFPEEFRIRAVGGGSHVYRLVGQAMHAGSLGGGHYWAVARRAGGAACRLNDSSVSPDVLYPAEGTYLVAYHFAGLEAPLPPTPSPALSGGP